jgi:hypothetical protein
MFPSRPFWRLSLCRRFVDCRPTMQECRQRRFSCGNEYLASFLVPALGFKVLTEGNGEKLPCRARIKSYEERARS